jgi:O-succinylbenzoate synthase
VVAVGSIDGGGVMGLDVLPVAVELRRVRLPLVRPMVAAHGIERDRDVVLVAATLADGTVGWGECSTLGRPTYTGEWTEGAWGILCDEFVPALLAGRASDVVGHPMASASVSTALLDARLRSSGVNLAGALGAGFGRAMPSTTVPGTAVPSSTVPGTAVPSSTVPGTAVPSSTVPGTAAPSTSVLSTAVTGIQPTVDDLLACVATDLATGHRSVKCKIRPGWDVEPLAAVRSTWPDLGLAADANGAYDRSDLDHLASLDRLGLLYLEQPFAADELLPSAELVRMVATPIALDESVTSVATVDVIVALGAAGVLSIKPARLGGIDEAARVADLAVDRGLGAFVGGMLETGVGRAAALAVAALPGCGLPTDLGPSSRYFLADLTASLCLDALGALPVPTGPGIGVTPDADRLDAATVDHVVLTR